MGDEAAGDARVPRPSVLHGTTLYGDTPMGPLRMTANKDAAGQPFEVFLTASKMGSEAAAVAEALGRLVTFALRVDPRATPTERLHGVAAQLRDIGGPRTTGETRSLPDGLARLLDEYLGDDVATDGRALDLCPDCGDAAYMSGSCSSCD